MELTTLWHGDVYDLRSPIDFLAEQKNLEELSTGFLYRSNVEAVFTIIFKNLLKLKTLEVKFQTSPKTNFYNNLPSNLSVRKLKIRGINHVKYYESIRALISKLPNVETLVLHTDVSGSVYLSILNAMNKLKNLKQLKYIDFFGKVFHQQDDPK